MVDNIINKAEALLAKVKSVGIPSISQAKVKSNPSDFDLSTIDYLLKDIPEAYCEDPQVNDEEIDEILKAGGPLPSQLALPSLYLSNIQAIEKLRNVTKINISLDHLLIYHAQFGIRKEGSFFVITPPKSNSTENLSIDSIKLDLFELQTDRYSSIKSKDKNESLRNFAVGGIDLKNKKISFDIRVDDQIVQDWLNAKNGLIIELFSYLTPLGTKIRGIEPEPVRFAIAHIYLDGLVGSPTLDAIANCILYADQLTQSKVIGRMQALSFGKKISSLGTKVGVLSMKIGLVSEETKYSFDVTRNNLFQFQNQKFSPPNSLQDNKGNLASKFVPEEAPKSEVSFFNQNPHKYFGLAVLDIRDLLIPDNIFPEIPHDSQCQILILYKLSFK